MSEMYLVDNDGTKRHIPDQPTYLNLFRDWGGVRAVADVSTIVTGPNLTNGAYLAIAQETMYKVYLIDNGQKRWVTSPAIMDKFHFDYVTRPPVVGRVPGVGEPGGPPADAGEAWVPRRPASQ